MVYCNCIVLTHIVLTQTKQVTPHERGAFGETTDYPTGEGRH